MSGEWLLDGYCGFLALRMDRATFAVRTEQFLRTRRSPVLRRLFGASIFIDYQTKICRKRRLARDLLLRRRKRASVIKQFWDTVEPMNARYVAPQARRTHIVLKPLVNQATAQRVAALLLARLERVSA
jgi:uridine kinase